MTEPWAGQAGAVRFLALLQEEAYRKWRVEPPVNVPGLTGYGIGQFDAIFTQIRQMADYSSLDRSDDYQERLRRVEEAAARGEHVHAFDDLKAPTTFESPIIYHTISGVSAQVFKVARQLNCPMAAQPLVGTMPTGDIHAYTVGVPADMRASESDADHLIIFDWQFFLFVHLFSLALASAVPATPSPEHGDDFWSLSWDEEDIRRTIERDPSIAESFTDLLVSYATTGRPGNSQVYASPEAFQRGQLGPGNRAMAGLIRASMELFVMGHEYGHVAQRNSVAAGTGRLRWVGYDGPDAGDPVVQSHLTELDADAYGLRLATLAARPTYRDLTLEYIGADAYFSGLDMMRRALCVLTLGRVIDMTSRTHPSAKDRRDALRRSLSVFPVSTGERNGAINIAQKVELIAELLWERAQDTLMDLHRNGTSPAPWWLQE
jgi:hypothetical protein